uniref:Lipoprotein NlpD n=1 Tax=Candidatus Kentrum sp. LFY TaxID=2126342 RepID=A0A450URK0_9GAMM|nr:MAG: lipoprotein NlpD [Candidatus Kentron sp. LFY]VFK21263.1 MAG: lipoprotein NlpD [Candidatus Kentron sp. LFY]
MLAWVRFILWRSLYSNRQSRPDIGKAKLLFCKTRSNREVEREINKINGQFIMTDRKRDSATLHGNIGIGKTRISTESMRASGPILLRSWREALTRFWDYPTGCMARIRGRFGFAVLVAAMSLLVMGLSGCVSYSVAPVGRNPYPETGYHTVEKGENVYAIALRYGLDYHELATWNRIAPPSFRIYPGQKIRLFARSGIPRKPAGSERPGVRETKPRAPPEKLVLTKPSRPSPRAPAPSKAPVSKAPASAPSKPIPTPKPARNTRASQKADNIGKNTRVKRPPNRPAPVVPRKKDGTKWYWPSKGRLLHDFAQSGSRGLDITDSFGSPIYAAAKGKVVYIGSGLRGYGKLIIIKHSRHYLSAYANNDRMLVKEGTKVSGGQKIAEMGKNGSRPAMLHFEIRKNGKPVNPMKYLRAR